MGERCTVEGTVQSVIFQNEENGYTVLSLAVDGQEEPVTVVGCIPCAAAGEGMTVTGVWVEHPSYGPQLTAESVERRLPRDEADMAAYLGSGILKGVGPATAERLVERFGMDTLRVIEEEPERLQTLKGITAKRAMELSAAFRALTGLRQVMEFLARYELPVHLAMAVQRTYGDGAMQALRDDPYLLSREQYGVDFAVTDAIALSMGFGGDDPCRLEAAVLYELSHNLHNGHVFLPREKLIQAAAQLIGVETDAVELALDKLIERFGVVEKPIANVMGCYLPRLYQAETFVAERLVSMVKTPVERLARVEKTIADIEQAQGVSYAPLQRQAVALAVTEVEGITRETLQDSSYKVDQSLLETKTGVFLRKEVASEEDFRDELTDELGLVEDAYVLYVDGEKVVATTFPGALDDILAQLKLGYQTEDTVDAYFVEDVEIRQEYVDTSYIMNLGYIAEILNATREGEVTYTVKSGDSYYSIAGEYGISVDTLMKMNPGYDPKILRVGDVLTISNAVPYLTVVNVERQCYVQDVPYPVEYTDDASMYQGEYKVTSPGVYGKADVTANVTYINGTETEREIVASVTLSQPVTEQQLRGTKERPSWYPTGSFGWPCNGIITSYFGRRNTGIRGASTYHEAIDIANSYGTPIYASDGGTVIYSGWMGGYGYLVKIDHGNGYVTYYGHNSSLLVSVGEHVHKGQQIARMGSTGISSGNHCDFRIQLNGTFLNPLNYL